MRKYIESKVWISVGFSIKYLLSVRCACIYDECYWRLCRIIPNFTAEK